MEYDDDELLREPETLFGRRKGVSIMGLVDLVLSVLLFFTVWLFLTEPWTGLILFQLPHQVTAWIAIGAAETRYASHVLKLHIAVYALALMLDVGSIIVRVLVVVLSDDAEIVIHVFATFWILFLVGIDIAQMVLGQHLIAAIRTHQGRVTTGLQKLRQRADIREAVGQQQGDDITIHKVTFPRPDGLHKRRPDHV